jgi:hypothetical protein
VDVGHAHAAPSSLNRREDATLIGDEGVLLVESEFEDSVTVFLAGEGGEDLVVETEVGMVHVRTLDGSGELECEAAEEFDVGIHRGMIVRGFRHYRFSFIRLKFVARVTDHCGDPFRTNRISEVLSAWAKMSPRAPTISSAREETIS